MRLNFLIMPRLVFSTIIARVVGLEVVAKKSTTVGINAPEFLNFSETFFDHNG